MRLAQPFWRGPSVVPLLRDAVVATLGARRKAISQVAPWSGYLRPGSLPNCSRCPVVLRVDSNFAPCQKCVGGEASLDPAWRRAARPYPDGRSPGRERVVVPPDARSRPSPGPLPFLWGTSRQVVGLFGAGLSCVDLTNPSLTRHSSGT